nr:tRNA (adenine(22)-N(1))-methyltransferase TrmK [Eubacterium sp.]
MADIGCDHGYAAIWLVKQEKAKRVIAMDVNQGPIERAKEHVEEYGLQDVIECRLSNGTEKLVPGEVDTLMIAGMGGPLMIRILEQGKKVLGQVNTLVLQPQSELGEVRLYLLQHGFVIQEEKACVEEGKYYFAIRAVNTREPQEITGEPQWKFRYGTYLVQKKDPVFREFLLREMEICQSILETMEEHQVSKDRKREVEDKMSQMKECFQQLEA